MKNPTSKKIAALKPRSTRYSIALERGLTIRIHPSGVKSWLVRVPQNGRTIDITLGRWPEVSFAQAKHLARKKLKEFDLTPGKGYVLKDAFALWCGLKRGRIVSYKEEKRRIEHYLMKPLGFRQLDEISAPLVIKTVQPIANSGKGSTLKRILMRMREIMSLAVCAGYIEHNPISNVSKVFPPPVTKPMPSLNWRELPQIMHVIKKAQPRMQLIFLFSLASMLRPGEVAKLEKAWIKDDILVIPASQMKNRREHRVPITSIMRYVLEKEAQLSPHPRNRYVFAGRRSDSHISKQALTKWLLKSELSGKLVAHGLRSLARGWIADHGIDYEVGETCLSHKVGSAIYRAYQRSDFLDQRRKAMEEFSLYILDCAKSAGLIQESVEDS